MTAYQRKRQVLNKINARTKAISKNFGVDRKLIADQAIDGLDGVFVDEKFGTINIVPGFESEEVYKALEKSVLTATQAKSKAMEKYEDFIGPVSKNQVAREVKSMYEYEDEIEDIVEEYYAIEESIKDAPWTEPEKFREFEKQLSDVGKQWHDEVPYSVLLGLLEDLKDLKGQLS